MTSRATATRAGSRLVGLVLALLLLILVPFLLWGEAIERLAPELLHADAGPLVIAGLGIALLTADVVLPIPSSVVSVLLCVLLDPWLGALAIMAGMLGGFATGYALGRMLPARSLRGWVGPALWDAVTVRAERAGALWIMVTRPIPVLAEATAVIAGGLRLPLARAFTAAALSSAGVAACYGIAVHLGRVAGNFWLVLAVSLGLAGAFWAASRLWLARIGARAG